MTSRPDPRHPLASRTASSILLSLAFGLFLGGCGGKDVWVRKNPIARSLFYPPKVSGMDRGVGPDTPGGRFDHADYGRLLDAVVDARGRVDYGRLFARSADLDAYLRRVAAADRQSLSRHADLAFLLNAYNACVLRLVLDHPGIESILQTPGGKRFGSRRFPVGGESVSLSTLRHDRIRRGFTEPLVHFGLVDAAMGAPALRREPYVGPAVVAQLEDQARRFLAREDILQLDLPERVLRLSELFDRYRADFTAGDLPLYRYVERYAPPSVAVQIGTLHRRLEVEYLPFDFTLNGSW